MEVEEAIDGAIWRIGAAYDLAAWQILETKRDRHGRVGLRDLLGRDPLPLDPRPRLGAASSAEAGPTQAEMDLFDRAGIPGGVMSQDELDEMYEGLERAWQQYEATHGKVRPA